MIEDVKPVSELRVGDLQRFPVWQYTNREGVDETFVRPVKRIPVRSLAGKLVGAQVALANGQRVWALIGNVDVASARFTEHFVTLSIECGGQWFSLARYHDFDFSDRGPDALAQLLGLPVNDVFPISYDIRRYAVGDEMALRARVEKEPAERLSRAEIIAMAVP